MHERWAGLQDVRSLDFVDSLVPHSGDAVPARSGRDSLQPGLLAAPARNNEFRIVSDDVAGGDDAFGR